MNERRWKAGWTHVECGVQLRVVTGAKSPDDLRMEWRADGVWQPVTMAVPAILTDFFFENEDVLYPPSQGFRGGRKYWDFLRKAVKEGWRSAVHELQAERAAKQNRPTMPWGVDTSDWGGAA